MAKAIVLGAGIAGLAAAATLRGAGVDVIVLERSYQLGSSWRTRYDAPGLNTPGRIADPGAAVHILARSTRGERLQWQSA